MKFLQVWWPNQQCQITEGGWLVNPDSPQSNQTHLTVINDDHSYRTTASGAWNNTPALALLARQRPGTLMKPGKSDAKVEASDITKNTVYERSCSNIQFINT